MSDFEETVPVTHQVYHATKNPMTLNEATKDMRITTLIAHLFFRKIPKEQVINTALIANPMMVNPKKGTISDFIAVLV